MILSVNNTINNEFLESSQILTRLLEPDPRIDIFICSEGGDPSIVAGIVDVLNKFSICNTIAIGSCCSSACLLWCFGTTLYTTPNTIFMLHLPTGAVNTDTQSMENYIRAFRPIESFLKDKAEQVFGKINWTADNYWLGQDLIDRKIAKNILDLDWPISV